MSKGEKMLEELGYSLFYDKECINAYKNNKELSFYEEDKTVYCTEVAGDYVRGINAQELKAIYEIFKEQGWLE